jgi:hypothetical protein
MSIFGEAVGSPFKKAILARREISSLEDEDRARLLRGEIRESYVKRH